MSDTQSKRDPLEVVESFFSDVATGEDPPVGAFRKWLHPDCTWENSGIPPRQGVEECIEKFTESREKVGFLTWTVEYRAIAASGENVLTERVDTLVDGDGKAIFALPVMGTLRVVDGRIKDWRDYFHYEP